MIIPKTDVKNQNYERQNPSFSDQRLKTNTDIKKYDITVIEQFQDPNAIH